MMKLMNKSVVEIIFLILIVIIVAGCQAPENQEGEAAADDLTQLLENGENSAIAGQAISMGCSGVRGDVSECIDNGTSVSSTARIRGRTGIRTTTLVSHDACGGSVSSPVAYDWSCTSAGRPQRCISQCETGEVCQAGSCISTLLPLGSTCNQDEQCVSGSICGLTSTSTTYQRVGSRNVPSTSYMYTCESPNQVNGVLCNADRECASTVCGLSNTGARVCESLNQGGGGSHCVNDRECLSTLICGRVSGGSDFVCENSNQVLGAACGSDRECAARLFCRYSASSAELVCDYPHLAAGSPCLDGRDCASNDCNQQHLCR